MYTQETRIYYALLAGLIVLLLLILFFIITVARYQRKKLKYEHGFINQQFKAIEEEKERIAADLHDDLGSFLSAIKMGLQAVPPNLEAMQHHIEITEGQIDRALEKIRQVSRNMMPSVLKRKGLAAACRELLDYIEEHTQMKVTFLTTDIHASMETQVQLYRITREILNNIVKHADAKAIYFNLSQENGTLSLLIKDDGRGFDKKTIFHKSEGSGLRNILARAEMINAKVYLTSYPHTGVEFLIETKSLWNQPK